MKKKSRPVDSIKKTYDEVTYASKPFSKTAIAAIAARAKLWGLKPAPPETARVLELGCSFGGNIITQALYYPNASFVGIDLSSEQIKKGVDIIQAMGLTNIRLEEKNILQIDEAFGQFDYIIVHGIWSWVPDQVKDKILSICNHNLSDQGVAYVSYNTYPGWKRLEQFRDIMLYATKDKQDMPLADRTSYGKKTLELLGQTMNLDEGIRSNQNYKIRNLDTVLQSNDYYVAHEYLEIFNDPVYFHEFAARAKAQGCAYIGDCTMTLSYTSWLSSQMQQNIHALADSDPIAKEQYIDYVFDTQFRCSLLTKGSHEDQITRNESIDLRVFQELYFRSLEARGGADKLTNTFHQALKTIMDQGQVFQLQDVIDYLGRTYPGLPINQGQLLERILYLIVINHLDVYTTAPHYVDFEDNITYVPQGVIQYATALIEGKGNAYITPADPFNQTNNLLDSNLLFVMKLLAAPRTRASLLQELSQLSITKTTPDGLSYQISPEQYLDDCLRKLKSLAYLAK